MMEKKERNKIVRKIKRLKEIYGINDLELQIALYRLYEHYLSNDELEMFLCEILEYKFNKRNQQ